MYLTAERYEEAHLANLLDPLHQNRPTKTHSSITKKSRKLPFYVWDNQQNIDLKKLKYHVSERNVQEDCSFGIEWIVFESDLTTSLLKNPIGNILRGCGYSKDELARAEYNPLIVPQIARQFQVDSAQYLWAKRINTRCLLTPSFLQDDDELIEGNDILPEELLLEFNTDKILEYLNRYLSLRNISEEDISLINKNFIKQTIFNRFIEQEDEHHGNWGIITENRRAKLAPVYDTDFSCGITKKRGTGTKRICNNGDSSLSSVIMQYKELPWMKDFLFDIIKNFNIEQVYKDMKYYTNVDIEEKYKDYYTNYLEKRLIELEKAYCHAYPSIEHDRKGDERE